MPKRVIYTIQRHSFLGSATIRTGIRNQEIYKTYIKIIIQTLLNIWGSRVPHDIFGSLGWVGSFYLFFCGLLFIPPLPGVCPCWVFLSIFFWTFNTKKARSRRLTVSFLIKSYLWFTFSAIVTSMCFSLFVASYVRNVIFLIFGIPLFVILNRAAFAPRLLSVFASLVISEFGILFVYRAFGTVYHIIQSWWVAGKSNPAELGKSQSCRLKHLQPIWNSWILNICCSVNNQFSANAETHGFSET